MNKCACGERNASECEEEWGPDCDLGNNEKYVKVVKPNTPAPVAQPDHETWRAELWELIDGYRKGHDWPLAMRGRIKAHIAKMPATAPVAQPLTTPKDKPGATFVEGYGYVHTAAVRAIERAHGIEATGQEVQPAAGRTPAST